MPALAWKAEYSVHIRRLDRQHRRILAIMNELLEAAEKGTSKEMLGGVLEQLRDYIKEHFSAEEQYMREHGYPGYEEQKREHDRFIDRVCEFQNRFLKSGSVVSINLFNFIWDWFSGHILRLDKGYDRYFRESSSA